MSRTKPKSLFHIILTCMNEITAMAQDESSGMPITAGFDPEPLNNFFLKSEDSKFSLRLGAFTQFRYNANFREKTPDSVEWVTRGFNINLTRIFTEGDLGDKCGYYFLTQINAYGSAWHSIFNYWISPL